MDYRYWAHHEHLTSRLVIDEAHQVLSQGNFRHLFEKIKQLAAVAIPHIFLTATLPIRMEHDFLLEVGMPQSTRIIRTPTFRPNISYNIVRYDSNVTVKLRLIHDIAKLMESYFMSEGQIGIIFAQDIADVELIAQALHCSRSHSHLNAVDRARDYQAWISGDVRWMAATTTLTHGIDRPNIAVCIFLHLVYGLLYLVQGSGCLLRKGGLSYCITLHDTQRMYIQSPEPLQGDYTCSWEGRRWYNNTTVCRRLEISETMDGESRICADIPGAALCDICDPDSLLMTAIHVLAEADPVPEVLPNTDDSTSNEALSKEPIIIPDVLITQPNSQPPPPLMVPLINESSEVMPICEYAFYWYNLLLTLIRILQCHSLHCCQLLLLSLLFCPFS